MGKNLLKLFLLLLIFQISGCVTPPTPPPPITQPLGIYHIVGSGQTLYRISKTYGVDIRELMRLNNIRDPDQIGVGERLFIPRAGEPLVVKPHRPLALEPIERLVGKRRYWVNWQFITLHHSATLKGNAELFDRHHRRVGMGGLFYHFVIGNGTNSGDGEVEVGWRWRRQIEIGRRGDIQICLVGDFNRGKVSEQQFRSLVKLLEVLTQQYNIPLHRIRMHKDIKGEVTECPGRNFPFHRILAELGRRNGAIRGRFE
jgi:LysM repeat protein